MSDVTARFYVAEVTRHPGSSGKVVLRAATRGEENRAWASATPAGSCEMSITNPAALDAFEEMRANDMDIAITFHPVDRVTP